MIIATTYKLYKKIKPGKICCYQEHNTFKIITATDQKDKAFNLEETDGRWRILTFISPGCPACESTLSTLSTFQKEQQNIDILIVAGIDSKANQAYADDYGDDLSILTPTSKVAQETYRIQGVPFTYILDKNGIILAKGILNEREHLQKLLEEAQAPVHVLN